MKRFFIRWYLLNKRLFKKPVFILILCAVPVLIAALNAVTVHSDGFVKIAVAAEDPSDEQAAEMSSRLLDSSQIVHFTMCASPEEATELVRYGEADGAWIFTADLGDALERHVRGDKNAVCVKIVEREDTVALRLSREKLAAVMSSETCYALMRQAYAEKVTPDFDDAKLHQFFDDAIVTGDLFEFKYASGEIVDYSDTSYLMLPIRGVLAAAILLCGFAMAMFWLRDQEKMVFCRLPKSTQPAFEFGYHLTGIFDVALVVLVSLYASGIGLSFAREAATLALYCLNCTAFVIFFRRLLRKPGSLAAVTPLIIVTIIIVNPVLFNLPFVYPLRILTPVFYYLQAAHNTAYIWYGLAYFGILTALNLALRFIPERFRTKAG